MTGPRPARPPLQSTHPRLWLAVQYLVAGYFARGRQILKHYRGEARVLEVGCSMGLDSAHFAGRPCAFTGIDTDPGAIAWAARRFRDRPHMRFIHTDLRDWDCPPASFDYVIFCGTCHHIPDEDLLRIFARARELMAPSAKLVVIDYAVPDDPGLLERFILSMEEGRHVRPRRAFLDLIGSLPGFVVESLETFDNPAFLTPWPVMAHKFNLLLRRIEAAGQPPCPAGD